MLHNFPEFANPSIIRSSTAKPSICKMDPTYLHHEGIRLLLPYWNCMTKKTELSSQNSLANPAQFVQYFRHGLTKMQARCKDTHKQTWSHTSSGTKRTRTQRANASAHPKHISRESTGRRGGRSWRARTAPARLWGGLEHAIKVVVARAHQYRSGRIVGHLLAAAHEDIPSRRAHGQQRLAYTAAAHHHGRLHRRRRHRRGNPRDPASRRGARRGGGEQKTAEGRQRQQRGDGDGGFEGHLDGTGVEEWEGEVTAFGFGAGVPLAL